MDEAIDRSESHGGILEDLSPFSEGLVCRYENGAAFVACADQFEQHGGFRLIFGDVDKIVQDQQVVPIQALDGCLQGELAACDLQTLHKIGGSGVEHPPTFLNE